MASNSASFGTGAITNNGGTILLPAATALTFANNIWITGSSIIDQNNYGGSDVFNGNLSGNGTLTITNIVTLSTLTFGGAMTNFTGKIIIANTNSAGIANAGFLRFDSGTTVIDTGSTNASFNLGLSQTTLTTRNPETANVGELIGGPGTAVEGTRNAGTTIWSIGALNTSTTFAGTIENADSGEISAGLFAALTKVGTGKLSLAGQNTYSGNTIVSGGTLALIQGVGGDATISSSSNILINAGATLDMSALSAPTLTLNSGYSIGGSGTFVGTLNAAGGTLSPGGTNAAGTFTINGNLTESSGTTNQFYLATIGASNDVINVNGNLDVSSGIQAIVLHGFGGGAVTNGTYPLFTYTGSLLNGSGTNNFSILQVGIFPYISTLTNITATKQIAVIITSPSRAATNLVWQGDGANNYWDTISTGDWVVGATPVTFESGDKVLFSDSGLANSNVTIQGTSLFPASLVVSNSVAGFYTFSGPGSITGSIGLIKTNTGALFINNNNTYTGPTVFGGGTVFVSSLPIGGAASPIGAASNNSTNLVFTGGALAYNASGSIATDRGLTLSGSGGTIGVYNYSSLTITGLVAGSSSLLVNGDATSILALAGASTNSGNIVISNATLSDINVQNVANPTVSGLGNPQIAGRTVTINTNGILSLDASTSNEFGNGASTNSLRFIINQGGLMQITVGNATIGPVTLNGGTLNAVAGASAGPQYGAFEFSGDITVGGSAPSTISSGTGGILNLTVNGLVANRTFNVGHITGNTNTDLMVSAALGVSGSSQGLAGLIKTGAGTMTLSAANNYSGNTFVSNGVLQITGSIGVNATNFVIISGGTLAGSGTINASVTNQSGGTLAPGAGMNEAATTLNINNNLTMLNGSTNLMQVSHTADDQISMVSGTLTYGGILLVATNAGDATPYQVGNTFTVFNLNGITATGSFATIQPPPGPGLGWSGANLTVNGQITVVSASPPVANFTGGPTLGSAALPVTFTNLSTGATYWNWTFGDGSTLGTNSSANLVHTYASAGSYTVILQAYGTGGTSLLTNTAYIVVTNLPPVPSFVGTPTNGAAPLTVTFTNTTSGVTTNWFWSFGDGTTFTTTASTNVSHIYTNAGIYNVGLTATGTGGTVGLTNTAYITATNLIPVAIFSGTPTNIFASQSVTFTNSSTGNALTNWIWNFGDGSAPVTNLTGVNITHAYASTLSSPYTVSLTVNGPGGSSTTNRTGYIVVLSQPSIGTVALSGGKLVLSGTGGPVGQLYRILSTNNVAAPLATWPAVFTNTFTSPSGNYSYTNSAPTNSASFFIMVSP
jgi:autotransporter-associated beta strand protein